jgi:hypothetical protein
VVFDLFAPEPRAWLNYERSVGVINDGRWTFVSEGTVQPFESIERYAAKRVRDRFDAELLEKYSAALGIRLLDPTFYGPEGIVVVRRGVLREEHPVLTLRAARERLGLDTSMT